MQLCFQGSKQENIPLHELNEGPTLGDIHAKKRHDSYLTEDIDNLCLELASIFSKSVEKDVPWQDFHFHRICRSVQEGRATG
jgi:hypothetical protein